MATKIVTKNSSTASAVPTASDLVQGELAVNVADKRLFTEDNAGAIVELGTNPSTLTVTGEITANGGIALGDNDKATFGAGDDLQIYHDGSASYIDDAGTGNLRIRANGSLSIQKYTGETMGVFTADGSVLLAHDNSTKLETTSTGIDVTGTATMDGLVSAGTAFVNLTSRPAGVPATAGALWSAQTETGNYGIVSRASSTDSFTYIGNTGSAATLGTSYGSSGSYLPLDLQTSDKKRLSIASNGDISFYEDTGTTAKLFWDASAESLGIGTSSPSSYFSPQLVVHSSSNLGGITIRSNATTDTNYLLFADGTSGNERYRGYVSYDHNADTMKLATGASPAITIDSSQNVGIGTSSPSRQLEIYDDGTNGQAVLALTAQNTENSRIMFADPDDNNIGILDYSHADDSMRFTVNNSERMRIDSSGNVGIGISSPSATLDIAGDNQYNRISSYFSGSYTSGFKFSDLNGGIWYDAASDDLTVSASLASSQLILEAGGTERMRIDSSGNLLIGKTTTGVAGAGTVIRAGGELFVTRAGDVMNLNRLTSDGEIAVFRKDGAAVGSIGSEGGNSLYIGNGDANLRFSGGSNAIIPAGVAGASSDGLLDLGLGSLRFNDIYATNGTIQTSDRNEKQDIAELSDAEQRVAVAAKGLLRKFRWKDSVAEKGDDARIHFGIIAQDLQAAFAAEGLDAGDYAMFISTTWTDEETNEEKTRMGVRYSELLAFIISAI